MRQNYPDAHVVNLLREDLYQRYLVDAGAFSREVSAAPRSAWVVVDEVQRLPNLLNEVHRLIEEEGRRFVLCGSSARKLRRAGVNLLAGRAARRFFHPFVPDELGDRFHLADALRTGLIPIVWDSEDKAETLSSYAQLYLKEEVQAEALVRNLPGFARFLPLAALSHGQTVNVSNIARESGVARATVATYLEILEETLLCFRLEAYEAKLRLRERKHPKLYFCDPGLARILKGSRGSIAPEETGALFEGLVAQTIRAAKDYHRACEDFYYWSAATGAGMEVDFLLRKGERFAAVKVKTGRRFNEKWCRGLRALSPLKGLVRRLLVLPETDRAETNDGIEILPFRNFAELLANDAVFAGRPM